jgi:hypothetical protein
VWLSAKPKIKQQPMMIDALTIDFELASMANLLE